MSFSSLDTEKITIGRDKKSDVPIADKLLSKVHCVITFKDNKWLITDGNG